MSNYTACRYMVLPWFRNCSIPRLPRIMRARIIAASECPLRKKSVFSLRTETWDPIGSRRWISFSTSWTSFMISTRVMPSAAVCMYQLAAIMYSSAAPNSDILPPPLCTASMVENLNNRIASSTCSSVATGDSVIFAKDSEIRMIASNCLDVAYE